MENWDSLKSIGSRQFKCKYCGREVASRLGYFRGDNIRKIYICPNCANPTYFNGPIQIPAPLLGNDVKELPEIIKKLYEEIRDCTGIGAYTSAVLACRKLLMHIAVEQGAEKGKSFLEYIEYLATKGYVPPNGNIWVDHIREKGNEANHEIVLMNEEDVLDLMNFIEMLLKFIYEFPKRMKK